MMTGKTWWQVVPWQQADLCGSSMNRLHPHVSADQEAERRACGGLNEHGPHCFIV